MPRQKRQFEPTVLKTDLPDREADLPDWEGDSPRGDDRDAGGSDDEEWHVPFSETGAAAGELFMEYLLGLYYNGQVSAKVVCVLSFWAAAAGAKGPIKNFAYNPNGKQFSRHIDIVTGVCLRKMTKNMLKLRVPRYGKYDAGRSPVELPVRVPHEELAAELAADPSVIESGRAETWPPTYHRHPCVTSAHPGEVVHPVALYVDGVPTTKRDGVVAFWVYSLISFKRHLCAVVRKSELCRCGCKGWCSYFPIFEMLRWSFSALAAGVFPASGPLGQVWEEGSARQAQANAPLPCKCALLQIKGDWLEFTATFGLANWSTQSDPCFLCRCTTTTMFDLQLLAPHNFPFEPKSQASYLEACRACEMTTTISAEQHEELKVLLDWDKRKDGARGLALKADYPALGLLRNDRVEPSRALADPGFAGF